MLVELREFRWIVALPNEQGFDDLSDSVYIVLDVPVVLAHGLEAIGEGLAFQQIVIKNLFSQLVVIRRLPHMK
mgnify:CR=1 FL=1